MDIYSVAQQMKIEHKSIFDLELRVTFYARVSTTTDEQENSIENQIEHFTKLINENKNWTYIDGYVDRVRGESAENRASFKQMIEDGKSGKFDLVLTKEVSRFARNTIDSLTYTRDLLRAGVGVFFQNDNISTIDTDSELRLTIMSSIAADEVRKLSERVKFGHKRSIENGHVLGSNRIFGYDKKDCKLSINEKEAEMVKLIFNLYQTGDYSSRKIENILFEKGYRGRNGTRIHHNTISGIIQNPKYKGYYCGNKVVITDYRTKKQKFLSPEEWKTYKDETGEIVPKIVDEDVWNKCNDIFTTRSNAIKSRERSFKDTSIFTGKIWCTAHNKPYWRTSYSNSTAKGKSIYQWICSEKKQHGAKECASFAIMENELYSIISDYMKNIVPNLDDYIKTFLEIYKEADQSKEYKKQIETLEKELGKMNRKKETLLEFVLDETITKADYKEQNDKLIAQISDTKEQINSIKNSTINSVNYARELDNIQSYLKTMYHPEVEMAKEQIDELAKSIIERIDVTPVNAESMKLEIKLKTGISSDITYIRNGSRYGRRSGLTIKKMIDAYKTGK